MPDVSTEKKSAPSVSCSHPSSRGDACKFESSFRFSQRCPNDACLVRQTVVGEKKPPTRDASVTRLYFVAPRYLTRWFVIRDLGPAGISAVAVVGCADALAHQDAALVDQPCGCGSFLACRLMARRTWSLVSSSATRPTGEISPCWLVRRECFWLQFSRYRPPDLKIRHHGPGEAPARASIERFKVTYAILSRDACILELPVARGAQTRSQLLAFGSLSKHVLCAARSPWKLRQLLLFFMGEADGWRRRELLSG